MGSALRHPLLRRVVRTVLAVPEGLEDGGLLPAPVHHHGIPYRLLSEPAGTAAAGTGLLLFGGVFRVRRLDRTRDEGPAGPRHCRRPEAAAGRSRVRCRPA